MDGILIIDKPVGPTSHDVVARVRRALGEQRIGHAGTLDPQATGVLVLVVGRATRLARFFTGEDKSYDAAIRLGIATDTYDAAGRVVAVSPAVPGPGAGAGVVLPDREAVSKALAAFVGTYPQTPPAFSAKKVAGVRAYARARQGAPVEPKPAVVSAHEIALESVEAGLVRLRIRCSAGFYVRSLAHALGERLGVGAHLEALRRTRAGSFDISQAASLEAVEQEGTAATRRLVPLAGALPDLPAATLTDDGVRRVRHGVTLAAADFPAPPPGGSGPVRLLGPDGRLVAIARAGAAPGVLHPFVVIG
jgi:tRNA pseudouridine55 synthase